MGAKLAITRRVARDETQLQEFPVIQGSSGSRDRTLDDWAHLASKFLLGLP
jgi:hypothetical protein